VSLLRSRLSAHRTDVAVAVIAIAVLAAPLAVRSSEPLDFVNNLWVVWAGGKALVAVGHPTYFFNTTTQGIFNPWFAFYGGTLVEGTGALAELIGHPYVAYAGVTLVAIAAAYLGTFSFARQLGLRGLLAHVPALVVVTSAYYVTDIYQRGAWPEFMALSAIPPLAASGLHLVRTPSWRPPAIAVFAVSAVIFSGSHNITLLWGATTAAATLLILWLVLGRPRRLPYRRLAMVAGLGVVCALVNAWFLLTDVTHAGDTFAGTYRTIVVGPVAAWDAAGNLFDPFRSAPFIAKFPDIYVQVPDWFLAWGLVAGVALLWNRSAGGGLRRVWVGTLIVAALLLAMTIDNSLWAHMPYPFGEIQFPFRLNGYLLYAVAGIVLVAALALQRAKALEPRRGSLERLRIALVLVTAVSAAICVWQEFVTSTSGPGYANRSVAFASSNVLPPSWYDAGSYVDWSAPVVSVPAGRVLTINPALVQGDRFAGWVAVPPGLQPIQTNIAGGPYVVEISGLRRVGRSSAGYTVVRRLKPGSGPVHIVIETARTGALVVGSILSILALLTLLAILTLSGVHAWRERRGAAE